MTNKACKQTILQSKGAVVAVLTHLQKSLQSEGKASNILEN